MDLSTPPKSFDTAPCVPFRRLVYPAIAIACLVGTGGVHGNASNSQQVPTAAGAYPAVAYGSSPIVASHVVDAAGRGRVEALVAGMPAVRLGPDDPGSDARASDGVPAVSRAADGSTWVIASRGGASGSRLWAQRYANGVWREPASGPSAGAHDEFPAIAAGGSSVWATWIGRRSAVDAATIYAAPWRDGVWGSAEEVPGPSGEPMVPSIAVDDHGLPAIVWAADDGGHAEVWISWRRGARWSKAVALTNDTTPDVTPSVAVHGNRWIVAWSSFHEHAYWTEAVTGHPRGGWSRIHRISSRAGSAPVAVASRHGLGAIWAVPDSTPGSDLTILRIAGRRDGTWQRPRDLLLAANAVFAADVTPDGRLLIAWASPRGDLTVAQGVARKAARQTGSLHVVWGRPGDAAAPDELPRPLPPKISSALNWVAFGDSLTQGHTTVGGATVIDPGYPANLQARLRGALGSGAVVRNLGVGGETTFAGLARFAGTVASASGVVIMEGTNDVSARLAPAAVAFNLQQMAAIGVGAGLVTLLAYVPPRDVDNFGGTFNTATNAVNGRLPAAAAATGATAVNTHGPLVGRSDLYVDAIHPSPAGYRFIGGLVFTAINGLPPGAGGGGGDGDEDGDGGGNVPTTAPGLPADLVGTVIASTVTLNWAAPAGGGAPTSYRVQAGSTPNGNDLADFDTGNTATGLTATNVGNGTFNVTVRAVNAAGTSGPSNNVAVVVGSGGGVACTGPPAVPQEIAAAAVGANVTLTWKAGAGQAASSYVIEAGSMTGLSDLANFDTGNAATTFAAGGVGSGTYVIRLRAVNTCGISGTSGEAVLVVS